MGIANRLGRHSFYLGHWWTHLEFARTWRWVFQCPQKHQSFLSTGVAGSLSLVSLTVSLIACLLTVPSVATARAAVIEAPASWQALHFQDHPLVGTVWEGDGKPASWRALTEAVKSAPLVLVGEIHPNPDHHRLQAAVLAAVVATGKRPTVVWEMIPSARQVVLDEWTGERSPDAGALGQKLKWSESGWPAWSLYEPIAQVAAQNRLQMIGAALPRETMMNIGRQGANGIDDKRQERWHLNITLDDKSQAGLLKSLREGHCDLMPESALGPMSVAQRARDGAMVEAMLRDGNGGPSVLVAGNGHIRNDWGVGGLLSRLAPETQSLSIAQIEVQADQFDPGAYFEQHSASGGFDFLVFTPKAEIKDYCAELRTKFGKE